MYIPTVWLSWLWHQVAELVEHNVEFELLWLATAPPYPDGAQGWACQRFHYNPFHTREWWQFTNHVTWVTPCLDSRGSRGRGADQKEDWKKKRFLLVSMSNEGPAQDSFRAKLASDDPEAPASDLFKMAAGAGAQAMRSGKGKGKGKNAVPDPRPLRVYVDVPGPMSPTLSLAVEASGDLQDVPGMIGIQLFLDVPSDTSYEFQDAVK